MMYKNIEEYGIIGDLHTAALVGKDGSIDFMCFPHFDSPSIFAALLDQHKGGRFKISPIWENANHKQIYLPDTNILFTRFLSPEGVAEITDYMPVEETGWTHTLVRRVKTVRGDIQYHLIFDPRFNYGRSSYRIEKCKEGIIFRSEGDDQLAILLRSDIPLSVNNGIVQTDFRLRAGESIHFILEKIDQEIVHVSTEDYIAGTFEQTAEYWRRWVNRSTYRGRWREMVNRSALTLKLLTSQVYGSMVASPTFGLPEVFGGERNWDYRYTWIRDTSFALNVLIRLGYIDEARMFMKWLEDRCQQIGSQGSLQIMYTLDGKANIPEETLPHLEGYKKSFPVRIGNDAHGQIQLDIYGELMESIYLYNHYGEAISYDLWEHLSQLINGVCNNWHIKDHSIWEVRGEKQEFLISKAMCWVAIDRAIKIAVDRSFPAPLERWISIRDQINKEIRGPYWNSDINAFVQYKGSRALDASSLLMPLTGFISPTDPRWLSTLKAIENELIEDSHVRRYRHDLAASDGLKGSEGTFCMCTFWYVECLSRCGKLDQARFNFEKMLGYSNHLGLFPEELGLAGEFLGNFPQAFTHLSLINAAFDLDSRLSIAHKE